MKMSKHVTQFTNSSLMRFPSRRVYRVDLEFREYFTCAQKVSQRSKITAHSLGSLSSLSLFLCSARSADKLDFRFRSLINQLIKGKRGLCQWGAQSAELGMMIMLLTFYILYATGERAACVIIYSLLSACIQSQAAVVEWIFMRTFVNLSKLVCAIEQSKFNPEMTRHMVLHYCR